MYGHISTDPKFDTEQKYICFMETPKIRSERCKRFHKINIYPPPSMSGSKKDYPLNTQPVDTLSATIH